MKCYICLTDSIVTRKDYLDLLKVMLISARKNTSLHLVCLYDGNTNDLVYKLLKEFNVEIILHQLPYKQELMEIYPREWMLQNLGREIEYNRIFGTFMRMEIPVVEKEEKYVLYSDIDVIFNADILLEELPHPTYLAAAPEYERNVEDMEYFNAGVLVMNIQGIKEKYEEFILKMKNRERNISGLFDQGYLNELCFKDMELLPIEYNWKPYWGINDKAKLIHFHGMKPSSNLNEAGFITDNSFFRIVFDANPGGYAGYVYYFTQFYDYLGRKEDKWLYNHLQEVFNLYKDPSFFFSKYNKYKLKYQKYKKYYLVTLGISCVLLILLCLTLILQQ